MANRGVLPCKSFRAELFMKCFDPTFMRINIKFIFFILDPSPPLELSVYKKTGPTVVFSWKKPEEPNGVIRKYVLYFADKNDAPLWEDTVNDEITEDIIKHTFVLPDKTAKYRISVNKHDNFFWF